MTKTPVILRPYEATDVDMLIALFRSAVRRGAASDYSKKQLHAWAPDVIDRNAWLAKRSMYPTWVAIQDMQSAGFIDLMPGGNIDMLYVHPDFQRRGIATALFQKILEEAKQQTMAQLSTEASITARPFFEAMGFSVIRPQTVTCNGQNLINFQMQKML